MEDNIPDETKLTAAAIGGGVEYETRRLRITVRKSHLMLLRIIRRGNESYYRSMDRSISYLEHKVKEQAALIEEVKRDRKEGRSPVDKYIIAWRTIRDQE